MTIDDRLIAFSRLVSLSKAKPCIVDGGNCLHWHIELNQRRTRCALRALAPLGMLMLTSMPLAAKAAAKRDLTSLASAVILTDRLMQTFP
ncbi:hypothetical protein [Bradyrhizobium sp. Rc3b]|uniref:hypothetical protein n=1 Tax=Bradyrhizobium sp. Rc3b TaxID=1855322 RepID=UPI000B875C9E|nr:hypothetical protein [Bradyrhizobium sp. Rc3b]